jgi:hypothetical protein
MGGICAWSGHIVASFHDMRGVWDLQMADGEVSLAQRRRDAAQPVIRLGFVEDEIAREDQLHGATRFANRSLAR